MQYAEFIYKVLMLFERQFNNLKFLRLLSQTDVSVNIIRHRM